MSSTTLYQSAIILQDNQRSSSTAQTTTTSTQTRFTTAHPFTPEFVQSHLKNTRAHARSRSLYEERVQRRQIVLAERKKKKRLQARQEEAAAASEKGKGRGGGGGEVMGRREAAEKGVWRLREEEARWEKFVPLHRLWLGYMSELLGLPQEEPGSSSTMKVPFPPQAAGMHAKLVKADFHGSIMTVRRSKNAALVGASGIVVQETENTFKVVTRKNKLKVLPKRGSVFVFAVPVYGTTKGNGGGEDEALTITVTGTDMDTGSTTTTTVLDDGPRIEIELYGNQFCFRAADRAGRKFKHKETIEL